MKNTAAITPLDWITEPSPVDKKANCGKLTQVTVFVNGVVSVQPFACHRYDCLKCGSDRRKEIIDTIIKHQALWYAVSTTEREYSALIKRISRAGETYCAVGRGDKILVLTPNKVIENSELMGLSKLEKLIEDHLNCGYSLGKHLFRHTNGLFPAKPKSTNPIHIKRRYAVSKPLTVMVGEFERDGYTSNHSGSQYYMRPIRPSSTMTGEQILSGMLTKVMWAEGGKTIAG
jgi:hypothetical protein